MNRYREKDQTLCPKCNRMYCEGFWGEGVCTADMNFSSDPTSRGDEIAEYARVWYEAHRESWWERNRFSKHQAFQRAGCADEFMLGLIGELYRIQEEAKRQEVARGSR